MDTKKVDKRAREINLKADSDREFFLIHGYTGSPSDFRELASFLNKKFNANVRIILLKGHGTKIEDLDDVGLDDLIKQVEEELRNDLRKGRKIIIGGYSLGGLMSLYLSSRYPVVGNFNIVSPIMLKPLGYFPGLSLSRFFKKYWPKFISQKEMKRRKNSFYYSSMHVNGLKIIKDLSRMTKRNLKQVNCPCLSINVKNDGLSNYKGVLNITKNISSNKKHYKIFEINQHNIFYSDSYFELRKDISDFIKKNKIFNKEKNYLDVKVSAVVPAYNEGKRISSVLEILSNNHLINEIIVVDDGSSDGTKEVVSKLIKKYSKIKYLKNETNKGKGFSMDRGVKNSSGDIIFFCDADIINLSDEIIEDTIYPVINNSVDMFIAMRGNFMQKSVKLFGLNSGERALKREVWNGLPEYYKYRYRIEAGLNYYSKKYCKGLDYKMFNHSQPLKEIKYGFLKGTFLRWWMNFDVLTAYISCFFMRFFLTKKKLVA
jgi:esterase/lipase